MGKDNASRVEMAKLMQEEVKEPPRFLQPWGGRARRVHQDNFWPVKTKKTWKRVFKDIFIALYLICTFTVLALSISLCSSYMSAKIIIKKFDKDHTYMMVQEPDAEYLRDELKKKLQSGKNGS